MNRWQSALLPLLCVAAIVLGVLFALERSERITAQTRAAASAAQVRNLQRALDQLGKEFRWALAVANERLDDLGGEPVTTPGSAPTPTTAPITAAPSRVCQQAPKNPHC